MEAFSLPKTLQSQHTRAPFPTLFFSNTPPSDVLYILLLVFLSVSAQDKNLRSFLSLLSLLYLQHLEHCLANIRHSNTMYWMNEQKWHVQKWQGKWETLEKSEQWKDKRCKVRPKQQRPEYARLRAHVKNVLVYPFSNMKPLKGSHISKTLANLCF